MGFERHSFTKDQKARGRRKGRKKIKNAIQSSVSEGPNELLPVLNAVAHHDDYTPEARVLLLKWIYPNESWRRLGCPEDLLKGDPRALAPLWFAVKGIQGIADLVIEEKDPLCDRVRYLKEGIVSALTEARNTVQTRLRSDTKTPADALVWPVAESTLEEASVLLHIFDTTSDSWLIRLRKCRANSCAAPYFIEKSVRRHGKFCSPKCRQAAHRASKA